MEKMNEGNIRPELSGDAMQVLLVAYLDWLATNVQIVTEYQERGAKGMTHLDMVLISHIFTFRAEGTRPQEIINWLSVPRRTIRTSLNRMESNGLVVREAGRYYPTDIVATFVNDNAPGVLAKLARLCDAFADYRKAGKTRA
jgi:DNA-binding HxlR family transcriptional regulator